MLQNQSTNCDDTGWAGAGRHTAESAQMRKCFRMQRIGKMGAPSGRFRRPKELLGLMVCLLFALFTLAADKSTSVKGGNGIILPPPPSSEAQPVTENLHGTTLTDPYRWLEDAKSPATRAWIDEQMKYTEQYLSQVKIRPQIVNEITKLQRVEIYSIPIERGGNYFFKKRLADENQGSIYRRQGLHGQEDRLVDATKLSADQNTSVGIMDISKDGTLLVYGIRSGGADEESVHILDVATRAELPDSLASARYEGIQLSPDKQGLYYARTDPAGTLVFYHKLGSPAAADKLVFGKSFEGEGLGPMQIITAWVTENERYLMISVWHGVPARRVDIAAKKSAQAGLADSLGHPWNREPLLAGELW